MADEKLVKAIHLRTWKNPNLRYRDLSNANLQGANLKGADLYDTYLDGANLQNVMIDDNTVIVLPNKYEVFNNKITLKKGERVDELSNNLGKVFDPKSDWIDEESDSSFNLDLRGDPNDRFLPSGSVPVVGKVAKLRDESNQDLVKLRDALRDNFYGNDVEPDRKRNFKTEEFPFPQAELNTMVHVLNATIELEQVTSFSEDLKTALIGFWEYLKKKAVELEAFGKKHSGLINMLALAIGSLGLLIVVL